MESQVEDSINVVVLIIAANGFTASVAHDPSTEEAGNKLRWPHLTKWIKTEIAGSYKGER